MSPTFVDWEGKLATESVGVDDRVTVVGNDGRGLGAANMFSCFSVLAYFFEWKQIRFTYLIDPDVRRH